VFDFELFIGERVQRNEELTILSSYQPSDCIGPLKDCLVHFLSEELRQTITASQMHRESAIISAPAGMT